MRATLTGLSWLARIVKAVVLALFAFNNFPGSGAKRALVWVITVATARCDDRSPPDTSARAHGATPLTTAVRRPGSWYRF